VEPRTPLSKHGPGARRDLVVTAGIAAVVFVVGWVTELWQWIHDSLTTVLGGGEDEIYGLIACIAIAGVTFGALRWRETIRERDRWRAFERRYRTLVENLPVVTYTSDGEDEGPGDVIRYISPGIAELTGYTDEEWLKERYLWESVMHPDDRARVLAISRETDRTLERFDAEYRLVRKDGAIVWVHDVAVVQPPDADGRILWQGVFTDITARKEAELGLRAADQRYRTLIEQIPAITYVEDAATGRATYISPQVEAIYGYTPDEWAADPSLWREKIHPDDRERVEASNDDDSSDRWSVDYRTIAKNGEVLWIHNDAVLIRDDLGRPDYWQGMVFDITDQKRSEERLREAEERYRGLVEQLPVVIYIDDADELSTSLYVSPRYEQLTGYSAHERIADPALWAERLLHPEDRARVLAESDRTNRTGEDFHVEYRIVRADDEVRWVLDHAFLVPNEDGRLVWQGVLLDITERKLAEEALGRRDEVLRAAAFTAERFLHAPLWEVALGEVLERVGAAVGASRAYVFRNEQGDEGLLMSQVAEWCAPGVTTMIDDPGNQRYPYARGFERWIELLGSGEAVHGPVRDHPQGERADAALEEILSLCVVPVFAGSTWWGFVGFDECEEERVWQEPEIEALKVLAGTLGAAIERLADAEALSESQTRFRALVEQLPAITYIEDAASHRHLYQSPQTETVLGLTSGELTGERFWGTVHPEDLPALQAEDARTNATGEPFLAEYRQRAADGRWVWIRDQAVLIRDDGGSPRFWQGVRFDVTAQKEAEQQLRDAEGRYRTLVEAMPGVTYIDEVGTGFSVSHYVSPQIESLFGYPVDRWKDDVGLWHGAIHPDDLGRVLAAVERHDTAFEPFDEEYRMRHADGRWLWVRDQAIVIRDDEGTPLFSQGILYDTTAHKEAERQLHEAEQRFRAIVEHVPAAIYLDRSGISMQSLYVSPQIEAMTGFSPKEWLDEPDLWLRIAHPDDREAVETSYLEAAVEGRPWTAEYRMRTRDGRTIWVHDETTLITDEDGNASFLQGVLFDVTERKLAEQALRDSERREREAAERLRALDDMKNTFLAAVSHELRSPLTSILGLSLTLERTRDMTDADRLDLLGRIAANARKLDTLLRDLLDIDRLSRGIVTPKYRTADVGALARRTLESLDPLADRRIVPRIEPVVCSVDPAKVERIVENLLMNAARHTPEDRTVWLRVEAADGGALIAVDDDGPGIPSELRLSIFEPFRQGPTVSSHSPGTGIGLSLVARFAELHGGRAWVEERLGGGSSFRVFLPGVPQSIERRSLGFEGDSANADAQSSEAGSSADPAGGGSTSLSPTG
jgi:PAS domain S-box-containing protein